MILHHYQVSPFSEKIRAMFGYTNFSWQSSISPAMPPRPIVDPLAGGYRKIPVAQIGADIFCDTKIICAEIAALVEKPTLDVNQSDANIQEFVNEVDSRIFMAIAAGGTPFYLLKMLASNFAPWTAFALVKDRALMTKKMKTKPLSARRAKPIVADFVNDLDARLQNSDFIFGDSPTIADFSAFHLIWFGKKTQGNDFLSKSMAVQKWYARVSNFGHGNFSSINKREVFKQTRENEPREIPSSMTKDSLIGSMVSIEPNDYATDSVQGELVASDEFRWILRRDTEDFGVVHVHFPKQGFEITVV